jgi:flavin reductase (DIM6/NTAB) family NADH-FMN oxidoreductase RutF
MTAQVATTSAVEPDAVIEPGELRRVFGAFPTGVAAMAALVDGRPVGLAVNSYTSVSLDPPLVSVCLARSSTTWPVLRRATRIGVSILASGQESACRVLSSRSADRFEALGWRATADGAVLLTGASAWLDCSTHAVVSAGDHEIVILRVHDLDADSDITPLVFHGSQFRRLDI